jgi:hypothetical protein
MWKEYPMTAAVQSQVNGSNSILIHTAWLCILFYPEDSVGIYKYLQTQKFGAHDK